VVSEFEDEVRDRLTALVGDVRADEAWESHLLDGLEEQSREPRRTWPTLIVAAALVLVVLAVPFGLSRGDGGNTEADPLTQLPSWAREQLTAPADPTADAETALGTIRHVGDSTWLYPSSGGQRFEVTGLGDPDLTRPQWAADSALVLLRPVDGCPEVAELHPFGAVERLVRRCDALVLSPDGSTLLLGTTDADGDAATFTGLLELDSGDVSRVEP
jgi:hypothetical protein